METMVEGQDNHRPAVSMLDLAVEQVICLAVQAVEGRSLYHGSCKVVRVQLMGVLMKYGCQDSCGLPAAFTLIYEIEGMVVEVLNKAHELHCCRKVVKVVLLRFLGIWESEDWKIEFGAVSADSGPSGEDHKQTSVAKQLSCTWMEQTAINFHGSADVVQCVVWLCLAGEAATS